MEWIEYTIVLAGCITALVLLAILFKVNIKRVKEQVKNTKIEHLIAKFPDNTKIAEQILKMLKNTKTVIKQDKNSKTSFYLVMNDQISIANIDTMITRIQTVAHECIHSIQDKVLLWANFIFSNIYLFYFMLITILTILGIVHNAILIIVSLMICGVVFYAIRGYLEQDAMTRAQYVTEEYLTKEKICTTEEIEQIMEEYVKLNKIGIPMMQYQLIKTIFIRILIYTIVVALFSWI